MSSSWESSALSSAYALSIGLYCTIAKARRSYTLTASPEGLSINCFGSDGRCRIEKFWPRAWIQILRVSVKKSIFDEGGR